MIKKVAFLLLAVALLFMTGINVAAISAADAISQIKTTAEEGEYRFMLVDKAGITDEIRNDLAENDDIYLGDTPIGSVKVIVLDADTGKPVKDAECMLSFSSSRYTVNTDGSHTQIANPFLLFDLGRTPDNGEIMFTDTYFYTTDLIEPGSAPYAESLGVFLANIVDEDPEIAFDYNAQPYFATSEPELFQTFVSKLNGQASLKFGELKAIVKELMGDRYNEIIRNLFNDDFAVFSNNVIVKVSDDPQFDKLISSGKQQLTIGELRTYIDDNRDLFDKYVAARYFSDFGGFEPNYVFDHNPEYDFIRTYKDGTTKSETDNAYLGMYIFDYSYNDSSAGTGYAIHSSSFTYKTYVYADGYKEGLSIGSYIHQDHVDKDVAIKVYLSKDVSPFVAYDKTNALFGALVDTDSNPIAGATIKIQNTDYKAVTNKDGYFGLTNLKLSDKEIKLTIISPENGEEIAAAAIIDGKKYALDNIPVDLTGEDGIYQIELVKGMSAAGSGFEISTLMLILIAVVVVIMIVVIVVIIAAKKKKNQVCRNCGAPLKPSAIFCDNCGQRV